MNYYLKGRINCMSYSESRFCRWPNMLKAMPQISWFPEELHSTSRPLSKIQREKAAPRPQWLPPGCKPEGADKSEVWKILGSSQLAPIPSVSRTGRTCTFCEVLTLHSPLPGVQGQVNQLKVPRGRLCFFPGDAHLTYSHDWRRWSWRQSPLGNGGCGERPQRSKSCRSFGPSYRSRPSLVHSDAGHSDQWG